jgi:hypothetical protein
VKKVEKFLQKNLEVKKKVVPLQSRLRKTPHNGQKSSLKRLLTVQEASTENTIKFIEKR